MHFSETHSVKLSLPLSPEADSTRRGSTALKLTFGSKPRRHPSSPICITTQILSEHDLPVSYSVHFGSSIEPSPVL